MSVLPRNPPHHLRWILFSCAFGAVMGMTVFIRPQDVVDVAHVMSGRIAYPPGNPIGDIYRKSLSFWFEDIPIFLMNQGVNDHTIHSIYAGTQGGVVFAAITAATFVFSSDIALALFLPLLMSQQYGMFFPIYGYPIQWPVTGSVPGSVGMAVALLVVGLYSLGYTRLGLFLFGMTLSIHPVMAAFCLFLWAIAQWATRRPLPQWRTAALCLAPGIVMMLATALPRFFSTVGSEMTQEKRELAILFAKYWGPHWRPLELNLLWHTVPCFAILSAIVFHDRKNRASPRYYFSIALLLGLLPALIYVIVHGHVIPAEVVPNVIKGVMANRWLNYTSILIPIVVCASLVPGKGSRQNGFVLAAFVGVILLVTYRQYILVELRNHSLLSFFKSILTLNFANAKWVNPFSVFSLMAWACAISFIVGKERLQILTRYSLPSHWVTWGIAIICVLNANLLAVRLTSQPSYFLPPFGSESVFAMAAKGAGVILFGPQYVGSYYQGLFRRPVLHAYSDGYIYSPDKVDNFERLLQTVYLTSLRDLAGLKKIENAGTDPTMKNEWEARTQEEWKRLSRMWHFTDVIVPHDWKLQLPKLAFGYGEFGALYHVPAIPSRELTTDKEFRLF